MIIGACGFGSTGSSVVTDYLSEFDSINVLDNMEFTWITEVDGLLYLERALMNPFNRTNDSIVAIRRFLALVNRKKHVYDLHGIPEEKFVESAHKFIDQITQAKWEWYDEIRDRDGSAFRHYLSSYMKQVYIPKKEKKVGRRIHCWPMREARLSVRPENFYYAAQEHIKELLIAGGVDFSKPIALDQIFSGNNPQAGFPFLDDPYAVVVDRDPRDNYVFARTMLLGKNHFMPVDKVEDFISYYRVIREGQPYQHEHERVLRLRFEDLVYEYEMTTAKLRKFLHLSDNPNPKMVFDPELSKANTQVFRRFPEYAEDVKKIEDALPQYLFNFDKYSLPDSRGKMFFRKSPLNKYFKEAYSEK